MLLRRTEPFRDLTFLHRQLDDLFSRGWTATRTNGEASESMASWTPAMDVLEKGDSILLRAELPGLTQVDVEITVENNTLTLKGEKKFEDTEDNDNYRRVESQYGSFYRSFSLPATVDQDAIDANFAKGVLEITLPKAERAKPQEDRGLGELSSRPWNMGRSWSNEARGRTIASRALYLRSSSFIPIHTRTAWRGSPLPPEISMGMALLRAFFALGCAAIGFLVLPGGLPGLLLGLFFALAVVAIEMKLHSIPTNVLMGGVVGSFMGLMLAIAFGVVGRQLDLHRTAEAVIQGAALLVLAYLGMVIGAVKGQHGEWWIPWRKWIDRNELGILDKILDSSVLIDGRVAEVAEAGFPRRPAAGAPVRARRAAEGRRLRGLDAPRTGAPRPRYRSAPAADAGARSGDRQRRLPEARRSRLQAHRSGQPAPRERRHQRLQPGQGCPGARRRGAQYQRAGQRREAGVPAGREHVRVHRQGGQGAGQGVGYLDDGTMVVVDGARQDRGQTVDLVVTSVLQTSAGKMIFGKKRVGLDASQPRESTAATR